MACASSVDYIPCIMNVLDSIRRWYEGESYSINDDPNSLISIVPGIRWKRHWTAKVVHAIVAFHKKEWKWAIPIYITIIGILGALFSR